MCRGIPAVIRVLSAVARNSFIICRATKARVLFAPESRQWINAGRSPRRRIAR